MKSASDAIKLITKYVPFAENLSAWERYEGKRDALGEKLDAANAEFKETRKVFDLANTSNEHATRVATAAAMRKDIEETNAAMTDAKAILDKLMGETKKGQLNDEVGVEEHCLLVVIFRVRIDERNAE